MFLPPIIAGIYTTNIANTVNIKDIIVLTPFIFPNNKINPKKINAKISKAPVLEYDSKCHLISLPGVKT